MLAGRLNIFGDMNHSHVRQDSIHGICLKQVFWTSMVVVFCWPLVIGSIYGIYIYLDLVDVYAKCK